MSRPYNEVRLGRSRNWEVLIGTVIGASFAAVAVWFGVVVIFSLG